MKEFVDDNGKWKVEDNCNILVEPSQKWLDERDSKIPERRKNEIKAKLQELDAGLPRSVEDFADVMINKGIISWSDIPYAKQRKEQKQALRQELRDLEG